MKIKSDVDLMGIQPQAVLAMMVSVQVYADIGVPWRLTSALEGKHSYASLHYTGNAFDLGIRGEHGLIVDQQTQFDLRNALHLALTPQFDVCLEKSHIHVEFQPKSGLP